jgi:membrane-bound inhibitor of C-type lysozyme
MKTNYLFHLVVTALCVLTSIQSCQNSVKSNPVNRAESTEGDQDKLTTVLYKCAGDQTVRVVYDNRDEKNPLANVQIDMRRAKMITMKRVEAASGIRYSDGKLIWWSKGKTAFLTEAVGKGKILIDHCTEYKIVK